jgi:hypothetical protein
MTTRFPTRFSQIPGPPAPDPDPPPPVGDVTVGIQRHGATPHQLFAPSCWINAPIPPNVAIDPISPSTAAELDSEDTVGNKALLGTIRYSAPTYMVSASLPRVPVKFHSTPQNYQRAMQQIILDPGVPIPPQHVNQGDSDDECVIYIPELDIAMEFWRLRPLKDAAGNPTTVAYSYPMPDGSTWTGNVAWECSSMWNVTTVSTHLGRSRNRTQGATYPNAPTTQAKRLIYEDTNMSVAATRIPFTGLMLTVEDVQRGLNADGTLTGVEPDHALNLSVIHPRQEPTSAVKWPASATDGWVANSPVREGDRYTFDQAKYTVAYINSLNVHPLCRLCIWFVVRRAMVVVDKAGSLEIDAEPGVHAYFNGFAPSEVLINFPWPDILVIATGSDSNPNPTA